MLLPASGTQLSAKASRTRGKQTTNNEHGVKNQGMLKTQSIQEAMIWLP